MKRMLLAAMASLALIGAGLPSASANAQTVSVKLTGVGPTNDGHYYTGPYQGTANGAPVTLYCVDFFHEVTQGQVWTANVSNLGGDLSNTRFGNAGLANYQQMAFLSSQFATTLDPNVVNAIQHAIWSLYYNPPSSFSTTYFASDLTNAADQTGAAWWLNYASSHYAGLDYSKYNILTDINPQDPHSVQEFITTPEPTSMALLGTGLIGLVPMIRRKKYLLS